MEQRFDATPIKAERSQEGFIRDTPVLTRTGVFPYRQPDGRTRYELRPPDEVFNADSLASLRGLPVTDRHPGLVSSQNAKQHTIGAVLTEGRQDDQRVVADIVIHDTSPIEAGRKELSCGYTLQLDETPGEWQGQRYDAVQRQIRYNHVAVVKQGRAGISRLNMDAADADEPEDHKKEQRNMTQQEVRLDSGLTYKADPEIVVELERLRGATKSEQTRADKLEAERDCAMDDLKKAKAELDKARADGANQARARLELERQAAELGIKVAQDAKDRDIREQVIKHVRGDSALDLSGKSDDYVTAAFDMAIGDRKQRTDALGSQRQHVRGDSTDQSKPGGQGGQKVRQDGLQAGSAAAARADHQRKLRGEKV